jgi:hypothetical protein
LTTALERDRLLSTVVRNNKAGVRSRILAISELNKAAGRHSAAHHRYALLVHAHRLCRACREAIEHAIGSCR